MGLDTNGTKFLLYAQNQGVSFAKTAMIGRQTLYLSAKNLAKNLALFERGANLSEAERILTASDGYAEAFFERLGARQTYSFDASLYEGATHAHDFNLPIAEEFKNQFTAVIDGGTLEHIFNFPTAIKNCLEMVAVGGHFLSITPTNNFLGHGFYQFSPELFFRILNQTNGFELQQLLIFEDFMNSNWYRVVDPDKVRERVTLINKKPAYLLVIAKKIKTVPIFAQPPQQSDYFAIWQKANETGNVPDALSANKSPQTIRRMLRKPIILWRLIKHHWEQSRGEINQKTAHFKKIDFK